MGIRGSLTARAVVRTTALVALGGLLAGPAAGAQAGPASGGARTEPSRVVVTDETRDVWRADRRTDEWVEVGALPEIDILRAVVRHDRGAVTIRTVFRDLQPRDRTTFWVGFQLPGRDFAFTRVVARRGQMAGGVNLLREPGGAKIDCDGLDHAIDRDADTVTVRVPRGCLDDPAWVRANVSAQLVRRGAPNHPYADNAHNDWQSSNRASPKVWAPRS
jgi:hypothetical protein